MKTRVEGAEVEARFLQLYLHLIDLTLESQKKLYNYKTN